MLALALMSVLAVAGLAAGFLQLMQATANRQASSANTKLSFYMAESGLAEAYAGLQIGKTGNVGTKAEPAAFGNGLFWVEATQNEDGTVDLMSTGMVGNGCAILSIVVERGEPSSPW